MYKIVEEPLVAIKENWKRYLTSSLITFVSAFLLFAVPQLLDDNFIWDGTTLIALVLTSIRIGVKAVWEIIGPLLSGTVDK